MEFLPILQDIVPSRGRRPKNALDIYYISVKCLNRVSKIIRNEYWYGHLASVTTEILGIIAENMSIYVDRYPI